jgi:hypothetical protein
MDTEQISLNSIKQLLPKVYDAIIKTECITDNAQFYTNVAGTPLMIYTQQKGSIHIDGMKPLLKYIERIGSDCNGCMFFGLRTTQRR